MTDCQAWNCWDLDDCRLPAAGLADQRDLLPGTDGDDQTVEDVDVRPGGHGHNQSFNPARHLVG
jgi:hypothetical protein